MVITKGKLAFLICYLVFLVIINTSSDSDVYIPNKMQISLRGKELRAVTGHFPPYVSIWRNSSGHITGYSNHMYHLLLYLSQKLRFTYKISPARENTFGVKNNGIWNGVIGAVANFEADIGLVPATVSLERYEAIEFCGFVGGDNTGILIKYPAANISFTSAFDVFSITVWIGGILSAIAISAISVILFYLTKRLRINEWPVMSAGRFLWHLYGAIISQGNHFRCHQPSQKLLAATWCFVTFVFVNTYNSTLTSYMSVTYQIPEINSFRDLAIVTSYKATVLTGSIQDIDLRVIMERYQNGDLKMIADRIQKCALDCRKFSFEELAVSVLEEENCVSIIPWAAGIACLKKFNSKSCRLAIAFESTVWKPMYLAVPKSSPYIEQINRASLWFFDTGLREYWLKAYEKPPEQCRLDYNSKGVAAKRSNNKIKIEHIYLPFLILLGGCLLAFIRFLREKFISVPFGKRGP